MKTSAFYKFTYIYLALPLFIFILSWLDATFAVLFTVLFAIAFYKAFPQTSETDEQICSKRCLLYIITIASIWCFFAGIGYFYYQSFDYHFRNAVFRDLINYDWPVFYNRANTPLVYYMAFWLPPAVLSKAMAIFTSNSQTMFYIGNIFLFVWSVIGVSLVFIHLSLALKIKSTPKIITAIVLFMLFSGLDIIGHTFFTVMAQPFEYHFEWWASFIQYSSITTGMFWVFNQFIPVALLTLLIYNERRIKNFAFLIAISLFFAPYPSFGIGVFMVAYACQKLCQSTNKTSFISTEILSIPNLIGAFWLLPLVVLYYITNSEGIDRWHYIFDYTTPARLIIFMLIEFLLYVIIIFPQYRRNIFFQTMFGLLVFIPFIRLDQQNNFCMRASIPAIIMLAFFTLRFLFEKHPNHPFRTTILCVLFLIGALTPLMEFYRGLHYTTQAHKLSLVKDEIYTLNAAFIPMPEFGWDVNHQYTAQKYQTDIFWQYISPIHQR